jgi:hypothetical protein
MATYTLRPNANWAGASLYTVTGTAYAYTALSDNTDSTYIQKTSTAESAGSIELEFTTTTIPANEKITKINFRVRADRQTATTTGALSIFMGYIKDRNSKTSKYSASTVIVPTSSASTIDTGINLTFNPDGVAWSQTDLDNLVIKIQDSAGSTSRAKIYEVYADVTTTTQPTVTVTAPSGSITDTSFPSVNWTYADTEADPQVAYNVKIFDSATYSGGSFDPETSTATVDTGIVYATDAGAGLTVDLANSTSYRAYVKVAQDLNGANYFSDWAYSAFSTSLQAPGTPSLSASYDSVEGAVLIEVQGTTNILSANVASIETDATGWAVDTNCSITRTTGQYSVGVASLQITATASGEAIVRTASAYAVQANIGYAVTCQVKANTNARTTKVGIRWINSGGTTISTTFGTAANDSTSAWTTFTATGTAPATAVTARVVVSVAGNASSEIHYLDKISFHAGTTATWTVGGFSNFTFDVEKSTDDGVTYAAIRTSPVTPNSYQAASVYDYEAPVGIVKYRAKAKGDQ